VHQLQLVDWEQTNFTHYQGGVLRKEEEVVCQPTTIQFLEQFSEKAER